MSSNPLSRDNDYRWPPEPLIANLTRAIWDEVMGGEDGIGPRLRLLEDVNTGIEQIRADLQSFGVQRLDEAINPLIDQTQADVAALQTTLTAINTAAGTLLSDLQAQADTLILSVQDDVAALEAQIALILSGGIPAANVAESATRVFVTPAQRTLLGSISAFAQTLLDDSNAAAARTTLGLGSAATTASTAYATAAQGALAASALQPAAIGSTVQGYDADTAKRDVAQQWTKPQRSAITALVSGATITPDAAASNDFSLTLGHNATLANFSNIANYVGLKGSIAGQQDATGGRTLAFASAWFPVGAAIAPSVPSAPNAKFRIDYHIVSDTRIDFALARVGA